MPSYSWQVTNVWPIDDYTTSKQNFFNNFTILNFKARKIKILFFHVKLRSFKAHDTRLNFSSPNNWSAFSIMRKYTRARASHQKIVFPIHAHEKAALKRDYKKHYYYLTDEIESASAVKFDFNRAIHIWKKYKSDTSLPSNTRVRVWKQRAAEFNIFYRVMYRFENRAFLSPLRMHPSPPEAAKHQDPEQYAIKFP